ncbi:DUF1416 domain-containing protein [Actinoplanes sp. G11-F43]|uniref:DUF1416 domain-containing protein n=1 Tax=Actinoplanes sp. G11-F43 TaxID=3424130 RepID=UPI003D338D0F
MTSPATNVASGAAGCAAPDQSAPLPSSVDLAKETVITGSVRNGAGEVVGGAYVRLLDSSGEFTAEVVSSPEGVFRFFAAPGSWTVKALSQQGKGELAVDADRGINEITVTVATV